MRKIILYTASSLDGFIAGPNDELDWLYTDGDYGYKEFYDSIETTLTGNRTYRVILSFGEFPYPDKENYIFTRDPGAIDTGLVKFIRDEPARFARELKKSQGGNIWLVGGGQINTLLLNEGLIDEMVVSIHPVILGKGIPLFGDKARRSTLKTVDTKLFDSGLIQVFLKAG